MLPLCLTDKRLIGHAVRDLETCSSEFFALFGAPPNVRYHYCHEQATPCPAGREFRVWTTDGHVSATD
ncbi:hypothetical protein [Hyalangium sp.]|uniref:hypothetical protein n=1 Tax=Hyalangium sp. TaxID=2028555 RepID=UPI002D3AB805|nr:hypothetical protein [Hyalangium sp.]HYH97501.1 hypothetical protein [Hyalangium sp.]